MSESAPGADSEIPFLCSGLQAGAGFVIGLV
jgi:hypothetical protein